MNHTLYDLRDFDASNVANVALVSLGRNKKKVENLREFT